MINISISTYHNIISKRNKYYKYIYIYIYNIYLYTFYLNDYIIFIIIIKKKKIL